MNKNKENNIPKHPHMLNNLDRQQSMRNKEEQWNKSVKKSTRFEEDDDFTTILTSNLEIYDGYNKEFIEKWKQLAQYDILYSARSKLNEVKNTARGIKTSPKPVTMKPKTAPNGAAEAAFLPTKTEECLIIPGSFDAQRELAEAKFKGKDEIYVTFLRQSLNDIKTKIESGTYKVVSVDYQEHQIGNKPYPIVPHIVIRDSNPISNGGPHTFMIRIDEFKEPTWRTNSVKELRKIFENKASPDRNVRKKTVKSEPTEKEKFDLLTESEIFKSHRDDTVKILRYDVATKKVNEDPHLVSDSEGYPTKGDVDMQNTFLPDYLHPKALEFVQAKTAGDLIIALKRLLYSLSNTMDKHFQSDILDPERQDEVNETAKREQDKFMIELLSDAITILQQSKDQNEINSNKIVSNLGAINLFNAAVLLTSKTDIQHGADAGSPLTPENITVTLTLNPLDTSKTYVTHSEFEYLKLLHSKDAITERKIMDFNPCWFVKGDWRKDSGKTKDIDRKDHKCNNLSDENYNIEMWKLLFEKQLLQYKLSHSEARFEEFVHVILKNHDHMIANPLFSDDKKYMDILRAGITIAAAIIDDVRAKVDESVDINQNVESKRAAKVEIIKSRIDEIAQITRGLDDEQIKGQVQSAIDVRPKNSRHP